ncbi:rhodanese-like domain-containing protein [Luminiphilus sp.]|jgi:rhodanese-related sulfurtransferase|nr:rhodanese-like domain-containing protein [Luminiphilus sp.]MDA8590847.1 rhodanese-like domain-containing protein [Luminiphilus sp.]MDA8946363.1 rhodanese-like domain-containing protein [Luminiphilus sp.]MDB2312582.1 rhodanese-like domain-containing protein [Luminiphilus sp.]MDB2379835.1 rhodanese-like domain-containing protein [Luminiphilus sp.]
MDLRRRRKKQQRDRGSLVGRWATLSGLLVIVVSTLALAANDLATIQSNISAPVIIDVRTPQEFATGSIEGAVNLPLKGLPDSLLNEGIALDEEVVVYCRSGRRSAQAKTLLKAAGFELVFDGGPMSQLKGVLNDSDS